MFFETTSGHCSDGNETPRACDCNESQADLADAAPKIRRLSHGMRKSLVVRCMPCSCCCRLPPRSVEGAEIAEKGVHRIEAILEEDEMKRGIEDE